MKRSTIINATVMAAVGIAALAVAALYLQGRPAPDHAAAPGKGAPPAAGREPNSVRVPARTIAAPSGRVILVENGLLSVVLHEQLLGSVLAEIAGKSHVNIVSPPAIEARSVTIEFRDMPLEHGLQQLLNDCDVFFYSSAGALRSMWVYEKGAGMQLVPVPPENWASTAEVMRQLDGGTPAERISAIETLVARNGPGSSEVVGRALLDENDEVRLRALDVSLSAGIGVPRETLSSLTYDNSAAVRELALQALVSTTPAASPEEAETDEVIHRMMNDSDPEVRNKAAELLESRRAPN